MAAKPRFDPPLFVGMLFSLLSAVISRAPKRSISAAVHNADMG